MAEVTAPKTRFGSLELSISAAANSTTLAWSRDGVPLPAEDSPRTCSTACSAQSRAASTSSGRGLDRRQQRRSIPVLERRPVAPARPSAATTAPSSTSTFTAVRDVEIRTERLDAWLDVPKPDVDKATSERLQRNVSKAEAGDYYRTMYDLIVLALRTDMTRVVTYMSGSESNGLAHPGDRHPADPPRAVAPQRRPRTVARLSRSDAFITEQFAYFLDQLASGPGRRASRCSTGPWCSSAAA